MNKRRSTQKGKTSEEINIMSSYLRKVQKALTTENPPYHWKVLKNPRSYIVIVLFVLTLLMESKWLMNLNLSSLMLFIATFVLTLVYMAYYIKKVKPKLIPSEPTPSEILEILKKNSVHTEKQINLLIDEIDTIILKKRNKENELLKLFGSFFKCLGWVLSTIAIPALFALFTDPTFTIATANSIFDGIFIFVAAFSALIIVSFFAVVCFWSEFVNKRYEGNAKMHITKQMLIEVKYALNTPQEN